MSLFFMEERDKYFLIACDEIQNKNRHLSVSKVANLAINTETFSFFLTIKGYAKIIHKIRAGTLITDRESKKELYDEIKKRMELIPNYQSISACEIARIIDKQSAPKFYISEGRASKLYYKLIRERNKQNALRRRNDFYDRNFNFR